MEKLLFVSIIIVASIIFIACNANKNKSFSNKIPSGTISLPYDESTLHPDIRILAKSYEPYVTAFEIEKIITHKNLTDANNYLCWAYFEWIEANILDSEAEIIYGGNKALSILDSSLKRHPGHNPSLLFAKDIKAEILKAETKANNKIAQLQKTPFEKLSIKQVEELAYYLADFKTDKANKEIEYKLWMRMYKEYPDTGFDKESNESYHGNNYFFLEKAADVLWADLHKYEEARPLLWQLIDWKQTKDVDLYYSNVVKSIQHLLIEAIDQKNKAEFIKLINLLQTRISEINKRSPGGEVEPVMPSNISGQLLAFALEIDDREIINYILNTHLTEKYSLIKDETIKQNIAKAKLLVK